MKPCFALLLGLSVASALPAQMLRPQAVNGAVFGGVAGAVIGNNSGDLHHNAWRGAAFGAGAGLLLGSLAADAADRRYATQVPVPDAPQTYLSRQPVAVYGDSGYYGDDAYADATRPNYAGAGLLFGALAGAIIGNNSGDLHHNAWRGAALGGATGLLLGSIAENQARRREAEANAVAATAAAPVPVVPASPPSSPQPVPAAPASPMSDANRLFGRE